MIAVAAKWGLPCRLPVGPMRFLRHAAAVGCGCLCARVQTRVGLPPRGAHKHKNPGRDPKSHVGGPGRYCSRGDERRFFPHPSYAGGLGELRGARGWLTWRCWPENATPVVPCRPLSRPRLWAATAAVLAVMLVWVNEKAIFCSDFSRVVFDGLL